MFDIMQPLSVTSIIGCRSWRAWTFHTLQCQQRSLVTFLRTHLMTLFAYSLNGKHHTAFFFRELVGGIRMKQAGQGLLERQYALGLTGPITDDGDSRYENYFLLRCGRSTVWIGGNREPKTECDAHSLPHHKRAAPQQWDMLYVFQSDLNTTRLELFYK